MSENSSANRRKSYERLVALNRHAKAALDYAAESGEQAMIALEYAKHGEFCGNCVSRQVKMPATSSTWTVTASGNLDDRWNLLRCAPSHCLWLAMLGDHREDQTGTPTFDTDGIWKADGEGRELNLLLLSKTTARQSVVLGSGPMKCQGASVHEAALKLGCLVSEWVGELRKGRSYYLERIAQRGHFEATHNASFQGTAPVLDVPAQRCQLRAEHADAVAGLGLSPVDAMQQHKDCERLYQSDIRFAVGCKKLEDSITFLRTWADMRAHIQRKDVAKRRDRQARLGDDAPPLLEQSPYERDLWRSQVGYEGKCWRLGWSWRPPWVEGSDSCSPQLVTAEEALSRLGSRTPPVSSASGSTHMCLIDILTAQLLVVSAEIRDRLSPALEDSRWDWAGAMNELLESTDLPLAPDWGSKWFDVVTDYLDSECRQSVICDEPHTEVIVTESVAQPRVTSRFAQEGPLDWSRRLVVNDDGVVQLDGVPHKVSSEGARAFANLLQAYPQPVGLSTPPQSITKPARLYAGWPAELRAVVEKPGHGGKGYRLRTPSEVADIGT